MRVDQYALVMRRAGDEMCSSCAGRATERGRSAFYEKCVPLSWRAIVYSRSRSSWSPRCARFRAGYCSGIAQLWLIGPRKGSGVDAHLPYRNRPCDCGRQARRKLANPSKYREFPSSYAEKVWIEFNGSRIQHAFTPLIRELRAFALW